MDGYAYTRHLLKDHKEFSFLDLVPNNLLIRNIRNTAYSIEQNNPSQAAYFYRIAFALRDEIDEGSVLIDTWRCFNLGSV